jgi:hypothetical protein
MAKWSALVPSMTQSVRRCGRTMSVGVAAVSVVCQEAKELAASRVEGALLDFGLAVGEQWPAVVVDEVEDDLLDGPPAEATIHLQLADDLTAEHPDIVAVPVQGRARHREGQQLAQERLEAFDHPQARRNVAWLIRPAAWPLIEVWTVALQGIGGRLLRR